MKDLFERDMSDSQKGAFPIIEIAPDRHKVHENQKEFRNTVYCANCKCEYIAMILASQVSEKDECLNCVWSASPPWSPRFLSRKTVDRNCGAVADIQTQRQYMVIVFGYVKRIE
jgi:hypothetical protein